MFFEYIISFPYMVTTPTSQQNSTTAFEADFGVCPIIDLRVRPSIRPWSVCENDKNV